MSECRTFPRYTSKCSFIHAQTQSTAFPPPKLTSAGHHYMQNLCTELTPKSGNKCGKYGQKSTYAAKYSVTHYSDFNVTRPCLVVARYGLDGSGFKPRWRQRLSFLHTPWVGSWGPPNGYWGLFPGMKWPRRDVDLPPQSSAEVRTVQLYGYSPFAPAWYVTGKPLPYWQ